MFDDLQAKDNNMNGDAYTCKPYPLRRELPLKPLLRLCRRINHHKGSIRPKFPILSSAG